MTNELKIVDEITMMGHVYQVVEEDGELEIYIDGEHIDRFHMLALALRADNKDSAKLILKNTSALYHHRGDVVFNELYEATFEKIARNFYFKNELYYQDLFKEKAEELGYGKIVSHKDNPKHKPDAWINRNDELIPVEYKLHNFDAKALKQLTRYMTFYHAGHGIAVARKLIVSLPENIEFVPFSAFTDD